MKLVFPLSQKQKIILAAAFLATEILLWALNMTNPLELIGYAIAAELTMLIAFGWQK